MGYLDARHHELDAPTTRLRTWRMPVSGEDPKGIWHPRYYV